MTNLLNIDDLIGPERHVTIRGVQYAVVDRSVGLMLDSIRAVKTAERQKKNSGKTDEEVFFTDMIRTLRTVLPECPEEVVRGLTVGQMMAILEFCSQDPSAMAEEAVKENQAKGNTGDVNDSKEVEPGKA